MSECVATVAEAERIITGQSWKDCACCGRCRIPADWNPPWCTECGGPTVNCVHCGTGRGWWKGDQPPFECPTCKQNPLSTGGLQE